MEFDLPLWFEVGSLTILVAILAADVFLAIKRPHVPSLRESALWVLFYVALALIFAVLLLLFSSSEHAGQFLAGWLTEYSLSIDNLFVFVIIMARFAVPPQLQQLVLMVGILIALVFRAIFILLGATLIENFTWIFYIFGAFLLYTGWVQAFRKHTTNKESRVVRSLRRHLPITNQYNGKQLRTVINGKKFFTPLLIVFATIGSTDVIFALDSIPAIFGITQNPFIVFTTNLFALMGLRQLYFLLGGLLNRLVYLHYGIAFILAFIGVKLVFHALHENELPFINGGHPIEGVPEISTALSLVVIVGAMLIATIASLLKMRNIPRKQRKM